VKKLYAAGEGAVVQDNNEARPRLEGTLAEFAAGPAQILCEQEVRCLLGESIACSTARSPARRTSRK